MSRSPGTAPPLLVVTLEPVAARMAGPAIRALELARQVALAGGGDVTLATTGRCERTDPDVELVAVDEAALRRRAGDVAQRGGTVLVQGDVLGRFPWLVDLDVALVVDAYDPFHLEGLEQHRDAPLRSRLAASRDAVRSLDVQLARADLVLCASPRQRALWLGHLAALGRVNPTTYDAAADLTGLLEVVPFGVSPHPPVERPRAQVDGWPEGVGEADPVVLWAGGLHGWLDPACVVRAMAEVVVQVPDARLVFLGAAHPVPGVPVSGVVGEVTRLAEDLGLARDTVRWGPGWVPYDERGAWLCAATVGVSTHRLNLETEFSFRTRLLDHLWAGLPSVVTTGDDVGAAMAAAGAGVAVPPGDHRALAVALVGMLTDPAARVAAGEAARTMAERWSWPEVAAPLVRFCSEPRRSPDLLLAPADRDVLAPWTPRARPGVLRRVRGAWGEGGPALLVRRLRARVRRRATSR